MPRGRPRKPPQFVLLDANAHEALTEIRVGAPPKEVQAKYNLTDQVMDYLATQAPEEKIKIRRARPAQQPLVVLPPPLPQQEQPKPKESRAGIRIFDDVRAVVRLVRADHRWVANLDAGGAADALG